MDYINKLKTILPQIPFDKKLHFIVSAILAAFFGLFVGYFKLTTFVCILIAWVCAFMIGIVKEIIDSKQVGNHFCYKDLIADALGCTLGALTGLMHLLI